jgi:hypothetical protein
MERDYQLLERLEKLGDDVLVGVVEVAAITSFAAVTIQQRRIKGFPLPLPGPRSLRWRLGDIRAWGRSTNEVRSLVKK